MRPKAATSSTVSDSDPLRAVSTTATRRANSLALYSASALPCHLTSPANADCKAASVRSNVLFPAPFGPTSAVSEAGSNWAVRPFATTLPR